MSLSYVGFSEQVLPWRRDVNQLLAGGQGARRRRGLFDQMRLLVRGGVAQSQVPYTLAPMGATRALTLLTDEQVHDSGSA